jgi:hypothetical protein
MVITQAADLATAYGCAPALVLRLALAGQQLLFTAARRSSIHDGVRLQSAAGAQRGVTTSPAERTGASMR